MLNMAVLWTRVYDYHKQLWVLSFWNTYWFGSTEKHLAEIKAARDELKREAEQIQQRIRYQAEDIKVELKQPTPIVFDEEEKQGETRVVNVFSFVLLKHTLNLHMHSLAYTKNYMEARMCIVNVLVFSERDNIHFSLRFHRVPARHPWAFQNGNLLL